MGGEGPAVQFSQDRTILAFWANRTGLKLLDSQQQEAVYSKAREFILERGSMAVADYGWQENITDMNSILHLSKTKHCDLLLPASFASFLEAAEADKWSKMFYQFNAKRDRTKSTLFIDSPTELSDIFYLLQALLPGMLLIYRIDDIGDSYEQEWTRALPPAAWVEEHKGLFQTIFGDHAERFDCLSVAAADRKLAEEMKVIGGYDSYEFDDSFYTNRFGWREAKDFTACDKECGYCGTCDY